MTTPIVELELGDSRWWFQGDLLIQEKGEELLAYDQMGRSNEKVEPALQTEEELSYQDLVLQLPWKPDRWDFCDGRLVGAKSHEVRGLDAAGPWRVEARFPVENIAISAKAAVVVGQGQCQWLGPGGAGRNFRPLQGHDLGSISAIGPWVVIPLLDRSRANVFTRGHSRPWATVAFPGRYLAAMTPSPGELRIASEFEGILYLTDQIIPPQEGPGQEARLDQVRESRDLELLSRDPDPLVRLALLEKAALVSSATALRAIMRTDHDPWLAMKAWRQSHHEASWEEIETRITSSLGAIENGEHSSIGALGTVSHSRVVMEVLNWFWAKEGSRLLTHLERMLRCQVRSRKILFEITDFRNLAPVVGSARLHHLTSEVATFLRTFRFNFRIQEIANSIEACGLRFLFTDPDRYLELLSESLASGWPQSLLAGARNWARGEMPAILAKLRPVLPDHAAELDQFLWLEADLSLAQRRAYLGEDPPELIGMAEKARATTDATGVEALGARADAIHATALIGRDPAQVMQDYLDTFEHDEGPHRGSFLWLAVICAIITDARPFLEAVLAKRDEIQADLARGLPQTIVALAAAASGRSDLVAEMRGLLEERDRRHSGCVTGLAAVTTGDSAIIAEAVEEMVELQRDAFRQTGLMQHRICWNGVVLLMLSSAAGFSISVSSALLPMV